MKEINDYFKKMQTGAKSPPRVSVSEIIWSWIGAFLGIGASAVLIYGATKSPLAQPRNLVGGHVVSAIIGVASYNLFHDHLWFASALAVATAIAAMHATKTLHPPGGATALIAVIGSQKIHDLGYLYAVIPVGTGALLMLVVALLVNNLSANRKYPEFWV